MKGSQLRECCVLHGGAFQRSFLSMTFCTILYISLYNSDTRASSITFDNFT